MIRLLLLPGLDGTGALFSRFLDAAPSDVRTEVVPLPADLVGYPELVQYFTSRLEVGPDTILLAESFSGPLAISLAARHKLAGLILCNSFAVSPRSPLLGALAAPFLFRLPAPPFLLRHFLVGPEASTDTVRWVRGVLASVSRHTLTGRLSAVLAANAMADLGRCRAPILYLRGLDDRLVPETSIAALAAAASIPVEVARIPGPHLLLQVAPDRSWEAIRPFLVRLTPA
jgi:pimeloyl-ACP methyl ester carboxylesterase